MDAEIKKMETGGMLNRRKDRSKKERAVLPAAARTAFENFVAHATAGKASFLVNKKAKPAAIELACSFLKWAVQSNRFSLSGACDYIPCLYNAVLEDWQEVRVGIPSEYLKDNIILS
jgi:hypothetical protein